MQVHFTHSSRSMTTAGTLAAPTDFHAVEASGFDSIFLPNAPDEFASFRHASAALDATDRLGVVLSCRSSTGSPTASVRRIATLAGRADGRLALFAEPEQRPNDLLTHQTVLRRLDEYLRLFDQLWLNERPIDHEGEHYRLHRAHIGARPVGPGPQLHMGGVSGTALQVAGRHADIFHLLPGRLDEIATFIGRVREAASARGRSRNLRFAISVDASRLSCAQPKATCSTSLSHESDTQRLISILTCYRDLGVSEFVIAGLEGSDAIEAFGVHVLPALRASLSGGSLTPDARMQGSPALLM